MQFTNMIEDYAKKLAFSGVIYYEEKKNIQYHEAFGYADRTNLIRNKISTRFGCASGTKFLTALGIGILLDSGKLSLDTKLVDVLPFHFPHYSKEITIHQLLTHTSGVFDYYNEELITDFDNFQVSIPWYNIREIEDYLPLFQNEKMKFKPGARFSYSNTGYILLGLVIEVISKITFRDFIQTNLFDFCDMTESGFFAFDMLPKNTAIGYIKLEGNKWKSNIYNLPIIGGADGGAYITTTDIRKLWRKFLSFELLSEELTKLYYKPHVEISDKKTKKFYGYGLYITQTKKGNIYAFLGEDAGVGFYSEFNSVNESIFTIVANDSESYWELKEEITKKIFI